MTGCQQKLKFWGDGNASAILVGGKKLTGEQAKIPAMKNPKIQFVAD